ncbi:MAG TPA: hypothetical protein VFD92_12060 [Candidatus Binatia bacterium]|nr:hypothetical protein [Candidatus Binatia bacterium]
MLLLLGIASAACGDRVVGSAPEQPLLAFDEGAAVAANGELPGAPPKEVCGADDRRFLAELTMGNPLEYRVPKRLADIKPSPSEVMVAGTATNVVVGAGDFPFDHTFGSDFNMDVALDAPYAAAAQRFGVVGGDLHVELAAGQLPHEAVTPGPASGQEWEQMSRLSREGIDRRFLPEEGERVLVMGHWIVDCGHLNFQTELHPITFMARAREDAGRTVVDAFYNPFRETQLYHPDPAKALAFDDPSRLEDPNTQPFPGAFIASILRIQDAAPEPYRSLDHLESWALLEPDRTSPVEWRACAPAGSTGRDLDVKYQWLVRPGVRIDVVPDDAASCAVVRVTVDDVAIAEPAPRVCVTPWEFLNEVAGEEAGIEDLDLQALISAFVAPPYRSRLDPAPILNCYDALAAPGLAHEPTGRDVEVREDAPFPLYGTMSVTRR